MVMNFTLFSVFKAASFKILNKEKPLNLALLESASSTDIQLHEWVAKAYLFKEYSANALATIIGLEQH
jgi:hypothetical protein